MIGKLTGILSEKNPPQVLVDCNGVGYEVDVPMSTFFNLPAVGERVTLLTHHVVREDAQILFGFGSAPERDAFRPDPFHFGGAGSEQRGGIVAGGGVVGVAGLRVVGEGEERDEAVGGVDGCR